MCPSFMVKHLKKEYKNKLFQKFLLVMNELAKCTLSKQRTSSRENLALKCFATTSFRNIEPRIQITILLTNL